MLFDPSWKREKLLWANDARGESRDMDSTPQSESRGENPTEKVDLDQFSDETRAHGRRMLALCLEV